MSFVTYNQNVNKLTYELLAEFCKHLVPKLSKKGVTEEDLFSGLYTFTKNKKVERKYLSRDTIYEVTDYGAGKHLLVGIKTKMLINEFKALNSRPSQVKGYRIQHDKNTQYGDAWIVNDLLVLKELREVIKKWNINLKQVLCAEYEKCIEEEKQEFHRKKRNFSQDTTNALLDEVEPEKEEEEDEFTE